MQTNSLKSTRRQFLTATGTALAGAAISFPLRSSVAQDVRSVLPKGVEVLFPRGRVPLSFIIDDSTCLVNMGHFCTPQFLSCYPDREQYQKDWKKWPREIPDSFVREFGVWCSENGVKGKYSIVPNPACVGWMDRELPGWSRSELQSSLKLVRDLMLPNWDIHPEMITHTRVIDLKTGRPFDEISPATMENSYPREKKSVDELAAYLAYALRILKNCDLPCEGVTTPGGFGNLVKPELSLAVQQSVRDVYQAEIPHFFKYVNTGQESTEPKVEHVSGLGTDSVNLTVNIPAGTGDWFGGWQGDTISDWQRYSNDDATSGRMVDLIQKNEPAIMLCHWPGMYSNGTNEGFKSFQRVVTALDRRFRDQTIWMKLSEIARYWAAKELTSIRMTDAGCSMAAPFAAPGFTVKVRGRPAANPAVVAGDSTKSLRKISKRPELAAGTWLADGDSTIVCFDLPRGSSQLKIT
jgi:hypothetical protein